MGESAHWDEYVQACPECDSLLAPQSDGVSDKTSPRAYCAECDTEYFLVAVPRTDVDYSSGEYDGEEPAGLSWHSVFLDPEQRFIMALLRTGTDTDENLGVVLQDIGSVNLTIPEEDWESAKRAWVDWLENKCEYLDRYRREYRGESIPEKHDYGEGCPDCDGELQMDTIGTSKCEDCGERWRLATSETVWWERVED